MKGNFDTEFETDVYLEKLLRLRNSEPARFYMLPDAVREIVEQYETEKEAAAKRNGFSALP
jgi:hypothetical protein